MLTLHRNPIQHRSGLIALGCLIVVLFASAGCGGKGSGNALNPHGSGADAVRGASAADPYENDNDPAHASAITLSDTGVERNQTLSPAGDEDWQTFAATAGTLVLSFSSTTSFGNQTNTQATLYDAALNQISFDDNSGSDPNDLDFLLAASIPADGTYYLKVSGTPGANDAYHIGTYGFSDIYEDDDTQAQARMLTFASTAQSEQRTLIEADEDWYKFQINTADPVHLHFGGSHQYGFDGNAALSISVMNSTGTELAGDASGSDFSLDFTPPAAGVYYVKVTGDPAEYNFSSLFSPLFADGFEDDDNSTQARLIAFSDSGTVEDHTFYPDASDEDWVKFHATAGKTYSIWGEGTLSRANLLDGSRNFLATSDDFEGTGQFRFELAPAVTGNYYVQIMADPGQHGLYKLKWISNFGPRTVAASDGTLPDRVHVTWDAAPAADTYVVFRATTPGGTYTQIGGPLAGLAFDDMVSDRNTYYYKVQGHDNALNINTALSAPEPGSRGLPAPANFSASDGQFTDKIRLSWAAVATATGYKVYRSSTQNGAYTLLGTTTTELQLDDPSVDFAQWWYKVRAVDTFGDGILTAANSGYRALSVPAGVTASDGTLQDRVRVSWTAVTGATSYKVYRADTVAGSYTLLGSAAASPYDDIVGDTAVRYYRVVAANGNGSSGFSAPDGGNASFAAPTNVAATDGTLPDRTRISWTAAPGAISYKVFRATSQTGTYAMIGSPTTALFLDNTLSTTTVYWYAVKATNATGDSGFSIPDSGYAGVAAPVNFAASDGTYVDKIRLTWDAVAGATGYKVFRSTSATGSFAQIGTPTAATFDDPTTTTTPFYYRVKTVTAAGDSYFSLTEAGSILASPTGVTASDGTLSDRVRVTWNAAPGATSYKLFRSATQNGTYTQVGAATSNLQMDEVISGTTPYWYAVKASNGSGDTALSTPDSGFAGVAAPGNVQASDGTFADHIAITWSAVAGATGYEIYRSTTHSGIYTLLNTSATSSYSDTVAAGQTYHYRVKTVTGAGNSCLSVPDQGSTS